MSNEEFKMEFYFNKLKDKTIGCRSDFKRRFSKLYGDFGLIDVLLIKIEKYQINKYGCVLKDDTFYYKPCYNEKLKINRGIYSKQNREKKKGKSYE
ncbi:MAG: hypothetical protein SPJ27_09095 [Candidatus Onthovivens sp.]|nr:hypothetical protein [Candidatus Onthovivens sp.]